MHIRILLILLSTLWLASCATTQPSQPALNKQISWDQRVQTLSEIQNWDLKAQIAVRTQKDAWSASLQWQQNQQDYHITLFGPLGSNAVELRGSSGRVQMSTSDGKTFTASSPEQLLKQQVGWAIPVSNLRYWVRGIPVPGIAAQKQLDTYNHLINLQQQGWNIQFLHYTSVRHIDVPSKIFLNNPELNVKILINQWQI